MSATTGIEWTDATWNPVRGCSRVSEGCRNCYAEAVAARFSGPGQPYEGLATRYPGRWTGDVKWVEEHLRDPFHWQKPRRIFVNSMSDLFHEKLADELIDTVFAVMAVARQHTFQILTKRPERMLAYLSEGARRSSIALEIDGSFSEERYRRGEDPDELIKLQWPLSNVWLGVSVENQKTADERIPILLETPAAVRFLSAEPLLESMNVLPYIAGYASGGDDERYFPLASPGIRWVIVGGESGPGARFMNPNWARALRDQCRTAGVSFFFKQWGEWMPFDNESECLHWETENHDGGSSQVLVGAQVEGRLYGPGAVECDPDDPISYVRVGKKAAGRLLDGSEWDEYPEAA